jgi:hypothetical protein
VKDLPVPDLNARKSLPDPVVQARRKRVLEWDIEMINPW